MTEKLRVGKRREEAEKVIDRHIGLLKRLDRAVESMKQSLQVLERRSPRPDQK